MPSGETVYCPECNAQIESRNYSGSDPMTDFEKKYFWVLLVAVATLTIALVFL